MSNEDSATNVAQLRLENESLRLRVIMLEAEAAGRDTVASEKPFTGEEAGERTRTGTELEVRETNRSGAGTATGLGTGDEPSAGNLLQTSCAVIGAGGLASAVIPYLAGAGVGAIRVVDFDVVDKSNLHRQVLFREAQEGKEKAICAAKVVAGLNSSVRCSAVVKALTHANALELLGGADAVVDASDNPRTRYLINDACIMLGVPLVSGSALGLEGQVTVYNHRGGPCYRCIFPTPLAAEASRRCSDNGVLGSVPGVIGCLQATEALKVLGGFGTPLSQKLCMYDAQNGSFYAVKLPPRSKTCAVCGNNPSIRSMSDSLQFAVRHGLANGEGGQATTGGALPPEVPSVSCEEYASVRAKGDRHLLLDVRSEVQYAVCALEGSKNVPLKDLEQSLSLVEELSEAGSLPIYCLCRRGVDSSTATALLTSHGFMGARNVEGGLQRWSRNVDKDFPVY